MLKACSNCGHQLSEGVDRCPNCGQGLTPATITKKSLTNHVWLDFILGILLGILGLALYGIGYPIALIASAFFMKRSHALFYGILTVGGVVTLLFLGLLYACTHASY